MVGVGECRCAVGVGGVGGVCAREFWGMNLDFVHRQHARVEPNLVNEPDNARTTAPRVLAHVDGAVVEDGGAHRGVLGVQNAVDKQSNILTFHAPRDVRPPAEGDEGVGPDLSAGGQDLKKKK